MSGLDTRANQTGVGGQIVQTENVPLADVDHQATVSSQDQYVGFLAIPGDAMRAIQAVRAALFAVVPPEWTRVSDTASLKAVNLAVAVALRQRVPTRALPSTEGGIVLYFDGDGRQYAMLEVYPGGEIVAGTSDGRSPPTAWDVGVDPSEPELDAMLERFRAALGD